MLFFHVLTPDFDFLGFKTAVSEGFCGFERFLVWILSKKWQKSGKALK